MHTVDEIIDGQIEHYKFHNGLIEDEPDCPDGSDLPNWRDLTTEWISDFVASYPQGIDGMDLTSNWDIRWHIWTAALGVVSAGVNMWLHENDICPRSTGRDDQQPAVRRSNWGPSNLHARRRR